MSFLKGGSIPVLTSYTSSLYIFNTFLSDPKSNHLLVPFLGSGASLLAAANLGMRGVGFDLGREFKECYSIRVIETDGRFRD